MNSKVTRCAALGAFLIILATTAFVCAETTDAETKKVLTRLEKVWEFQKKEIASAEISYRWAHGQKTAEPICRSLTPDEVDKIVNSVDYADPQKAFEELVQKLYVSNDYVSSMKLYYTPTKTRLETIVGERNRGRIKEGFERFVRVFDSRNYIIVDPRNAQVDITSNGHPFSLTVFRFDPSFLNKRGTNGGYSFRLTNETLESHFRGGNEEVVRRFDCNTGLLLEQKGYLNANGGLGRDKFQRSFFTTSNGISFPRLSINVNYEQGLSRIVDMYYIEEAVFNNPIAESIFKVALPAKANVWDYRYFPNKPEYTLLETETTDIIAEIGDYVDVAEMIRIDKENNWRLFITGSFIFLLLLFVIWLYLKKFK